MLHIKKYANGKFFDTISKEYIKPEILAEMIKKGEKIQVTLAKTGKDITDAVMGQFSKKEERKPGKDKKKTELPFLKTDKMAKWLGEIIDTKIEKLMDVVNLPSRDQIARLDENIRELNKKIDALQLAREKAAAEKTGASGTQAANRQTETAGKTASEDKNPTEDTPAA